MALDLNMDLGALLRSLRGGAGAGAPYVRHIAGGVALLLFALLFVVFVALPAGGRHDQMRGKAETLGEVRAQAAGLRKQLSRMEAESKSQQAAHDADVARFSDDESLGALYGKVAQLAARHGLVVAELTLEAEKPVYPPGIKPPEAGAPPGSVSPPLFSKVYFKLQLRGGFLGYLDFHRELAELERFAGIESLTIGIAPGAGRGQVLVKASMVALKRAPAVPLRSASLPGGGVGQLRTAVWRAKDAGTWLRVADRIGSPVAVKPPAATPPAAGQSRDPFAAPDAPPPPKAAAAPEDKPPLFHTLGVMIGLKTRTAIVQSDTGSITHVKVGDLLGPGNLAIVEITERGVVVRSKNKLLVLPMRPPVSLPKAGSDTPAPAVPPASK